MSGLCRVRSWAQLLLVLFACITLISASHAQGWPPAAVNPGDDPYGDTHPYGLLYDSNGIGYRIDFLGSVANGGSLFPYTYAMLTANGPGPVASIQNGTRTSTISNTTSTPKFVQIDAPPAPNGPPPYPTAPTISSFEGRGAGTLRSLWVGIEGGYGPSISGDSQVTNLNYVYKITCLTPGAIPASCHLSINVAQGGSAWADAPTGYYNPSVTVSSIGIITALAVAGQNIGNQTAAPGASIDPSVPLTNGIGYLYCPAIQDLSFNILSGMDYIWGSNNYQLVPLYINGAPVVP